MQLFYFAKLTLDSSSSVTSKYLDFEHSGEEPVERGPESGHQVPPHAVRHRPVSRLSILQRHQRHAQNAEENADQLRVGDRFRLQQPGEHQCEYSWCVAINTNKRGEHVINSQWVSWSELKLNRLTYLMMVELAMEVSRSE